ncbi:hypothetical protein EZV62_006756 [Acer yangbiense]|uniref:NB-ARC domain-containing protein n=1 Tax=Acer yangbiense TaxID=1000413 RepID=A0A5C7I8I4_9ROSI|nr:hypothetical protein EZV62_006756 [Acer yangbiense]
MADIAISVVAKVAEYLIAPVARPFSKKVAGKLKDVVRLEKEAGIPSHDNHKGCKLLLTTRSRDVLTNKMDSQIKFYIEVLNEDDAWKLFKRTAGVPIAIVTVAKALKGKGVSEWNKALRELRRPSPESFEGVTSEYKVCNYNVSVQDLLRYGMGLGLFTRIKTMEEALDNVDALVSKLKASSLLLDSSNSKTFAMHDVVRDVARSIASRDHHMFTLTDDVTPWNWAYEDTLKNCTAISLHDITKLLEDLLFVVALCYVSVVFSSVGSECEKLHAKGVTKITIELSSHCINVVKIDEVDNSKFNVGNEVEIHHAMKITMNNVQNILHMVTNMDGRLKLVEASLNEIMKANGENAANMAANNSRVDDGGLIVEEVNHNFVDVSSKDNKSISKSNKKMKSFSPIMTASSQNDDEQLMRNMVDGMQKKTDLLFPPSLFDPKFVVKPPKLDSRNIPIWVDESDHDSPNDVLLDRHYNIRRNLMQIRKANERKPSRYQLSPCDKCRG